MKIKQTYDGDLVLSWKPNTELPPGLMVKGDLILQWSHVTAIPDNVTVLGQAVLSDSKVTSIGRNFSVGGSLNVRGLKKLKRFGIGLSVAEELYLEWSGVSKLQENISIGALPYVEKSSLTAIPNGITIAKDLDLRRCSNLTRIGKNVTVMGNMDMQWSKNLRRLPSGLVVGGTLDLRNSDIEKIDPNVKADQIITDDDFAINNNLRSFGTMLPKTVFQNNQAPAWF